MDNSVKDIILKYPDAQVPKTRYAIEVVSLSEFFKSNTYTIPAYQRPYSWGKGEVIALLQDIKKSAHDEKKWFLGPIFTSSESINGGTIEILDGQQRLTTIVLILRSLYHLSFKLNHEFGNHNWSSLSGSDSDIEKKRNYLELHKKQCTFIEKLLLSELTNDSDFSFEYKSRFNTSISTKDQLNFYIEGVREMTHEKYQKNSSLRFNPDNEFAPTYMQINRNIRYIDDFLVAEAQNCDGLYLIEKFTRQLLTNLVFINIPLHSNSDILDIFETINNRGKSLSISDLIRFRSLKNLTRTRSDEIDRRWGQIFALSGRLSSEEQNFFVSLDSFLERYINSISNKPDGYTDNASRISRFDEYYGNNPDSCVEDIYSILYSWKYIFDYQSGWVTRFKDKDKDNVRSLIHILGIALKYSEASQISFIAFLKNKFNQENREEGIDIITDVVKTVFSISLFHSLPSNSARSKYIKIAQSFSKPNYILYSTFKTCGDEDFDNLTINVKEVSLIRNLVLTKRSDKISTNFILSIYQVIMGGTIPDSNRLKKSELDHIMPEQWFNNQGWKEQNKSSELLEAIRNLKKGPIKSALLEMAENSELYSESKFSTSFVQLIGNKFYIFSTTNLKKSNNYWVEHKSNNKNGGARDYLRNAFIKNPNENSCLPEFPKPPYEYDAFRITTIVNRTYRITESLLSNFESYNLKLN